jgi:hypothetical protein
MTTKAARQAKTVTRPWGLFVRASTAEHAILIREEGNTDPRHDEKMLAYTSQNLTTMCFFFVLWLVFIESRCGRNKEAESG